MKKNDVEIQLDYLELDKCKDDQERAVRLLTDIDRRNGELGFVRKQYKAIRAKIISDFKDSLVQKYPGMDFFIQDSGVLLRTEVRVEKLHGYLSICGSLKILSCVICLDIEESRKGKMLSKAFISKFSDIFPWYTPMYKMYKNFNANDIDGVFDCYSQALERLQPK